MPESQTDCSVLTPRKVCLVPIPRVCQISFWLLPYLISSLLSVQIFTDFHGSGSWQRIKEGQNHKRVIGKRAATGSGFEITTPAFPTMVLTTDLGWNVQTQCFISLDMHSTEGLQDSFRDPTAKMTEMSRSASFPSTLCWDKYTSPEEGKLGYLGKVLLPFLPQQWLSFITSCWMCWVGPVLTLPPPSLPFISR